MKNKIAALLIALVLTSGCSQQSKEEKMGSSPPPQVFHRESHDFSKEATPFDDHLRKNGFDPNHLGEENVRAAILGTPPNKDEVTR